MVLPLLLAFACQDAPSEPGSRTTPGDDAVADTGTSDGPSADTGTEAPLPLALRVEVPPEAPGVLNLVSGTGATDWSVRVDEQELPADPEGIVSLVGFPQGSAIEAHIVRDGVVQETLNLPVAGHDVLWTVDVLDPARSEVASGVLDVGLVGREGIDPEIFVVRGSDGEVLWWHTLEPGWDVSVASPNTEGDGLVWLEIDADRATDDARMVELSLDGRRYGTTYTPTAHHVGIEPVDGRYAFLSFEVRADTPAPYGGTFDPAADQILEVDTDGSDAVQVYSVMSQLLDGRNDWPCEHSAVQEDAYGHDAFVQWTHGNSLVYLPGSDSYLVYLRWIDTLLHVGRDGSYRWALSGPYSDFTAPDGTSLWDGFDASPLWSHGHFTDGWDGGVLMYDNGSHSGEARVVEVHWDETTWTAEVVNSWYPPSTGEHAVLGDARRLPGGNVLVSWTVLGLMQELTPEGDVVWEAKGDPGVWFNRVRFASSIEALVAGEPPTQ